MLSIRNKMSDIALKILHKKNNYNISKLGTTNHELSTDPNENKSLSVPEEILIPAPGSEHISNYNSQQETAHKPDDKSSNSEIILSLRVLTNQA